MKGVKVWKTKIVPFNPASRDQIAERLQSLGWKPGSYTATGKPEVDDESLEKLGTPEALKIKEYLTAAKRIGQLAEGKEAWLKAVKADGRIHGSVITNGAVTGRCTHSKPNIAQVPAVGAAYGEECRERFGPPP